MVFSAAYFFGVLYYVVPKFFHEDYAYLGGSLLGWKEEGGQAILHHIVSAKTAAYLIKIFGPFGFVSFFHPPTLILTFPILLQNLLVQRESVLSIFFQYTALLTPFVVISAIYGFTALRPTRVLIYYLLSCSLLMSGVSEFYVAYKEWKQWRPEFLEIQRAMEMIPESASVRTHEFFAPHLAHRKEVHIYENDNPREGGSEKAQGVDFVALYDSFLGDNPSTHFEKLKARGYAIGYQARGFSIFKNKMINL